MKIILDTANLKDIRYFNEYYPILGVTTNPTILSKEGGDVVSLLSEIRSIIGYEKEFHIQVTETEFDKIIEEAEAIVALLGPNTYVKIPISDVGLKAISFLSKKGIKITATAVLTAAQALLASNAGASYVAPYISRSENLCADGVGTVEDIAKIFKASGAKTEILAASFKTAKEVLDVATVGCHAATISASILRILNSHAATDTSIAGFEKDWKGAFGNKSLLELIKNR